MATRGSLAGNKDFILERWVDRNDTGQLVPHLNKMAGPRWRARRGQDLLLGEGGSVGDLFGRCDVNSAIVPSPCLPAARTSELSRFHSIITSLMTIQCWE